MKKKKHNMKLIWMRNILVLHRSSGLVFPSIGLGVSSRDLGPGLFLFLVQSPAFFCTGSIVSPTKEIFCFDWLHLIILTYAFLNLEPPLKDQIPLYRAFLKQWVSHDGVILKKKNLSPLTTFFMRATKCLFIQVYCLLAWLISNTKACQNITKFLFNINFLLSVILS